MDPASPDLSAPLPPRSDAGTRPAGVKKTKKARESNVKETIESIIVAFILAFIFRAFVVEAFVIPTGSMAPTLLGAHLRFTCPDCGYRFENNFTPSNRQEEGESAMGALPPNAGRRPNVLCPNCGYHFLSQEGADDVVTNPRVRYGDRILVLKYWYLLQEPARWDVVVFKSPTDQAKDDFTVNFIKRLIGRPNEAVMILNGDIYVGPKDAPAEELKIQRKTKIAQDALWRIVYDNDFHPQTSAPGSQWQQPWRAQGAGSGWNLGTGPLDGRVFHFDNATGAGAIAFDPHANPSQYSFTDWLAYDVDTFGPVPPMQRLAAVGDLKLQFQYTRKSGDGPLRVQLSKRGTTFIAEIGPSTARLLQKVENGPETEIIPPKGTDAGTAPMVEFSNVDYRVTLRIDGREVFKHDDDPSTKDLLEREDRGDERIVRPGAAIDARQQVADISHLSLWRDVYYIEPGASNWASRHNVMRLGPDEFFVCGDNSAMSSDGRFWTEPVNLPAEGLKADAGRVPRRFLLGRAFFVYWPAGYQPLPGNEVPALVPNFGDMRFIR